MNYRFVALPQTPSLNVLIKKAILKSPDNPIQALGEVLIGFHDQVHATLQPHASPRELAVHDAAFRLGLARNMEDLYRQIFKGLTYETAKDRIQKRTESGPWEKLCLDEWQPQERICMERPLRYSRIILSTIFFEIPIQIIAFVFLPLSVTPSTVSEKDPRSPQLLERLALKKNFQYPTETPIHDHQAPCTGATVFEDNRAFTVEDRFKERAPGIVDFEKQRTMGRDFQPVTDLKNELHPHVIHRVAHHSYAESVTPSLRVHIYGSLAPNKRMDYTFVRRSFDTCDIPEKREVPLFRHTSFVGGFTAHEA